MGSEWPVRTIGECASLEPYSTQIGPFGKALMADQYKATGVPVLRGVNVNHGRFHDDDFVFIDEESANRLGKYESFPGDVLLVHKGTLGQIGLMPKDRRYQRYIMGNSMMRVRCDSTKLLPEYLYYWLSSAQGQHYLFSRVSQVGVPQLQTPLTTLRQARLPVPSLSEQSGIVRVLGALDDRIELNHRMSQTLESMARALFKSWFVDFDPVRAKAFGRGLGLSQSLHGYFPSRFVDSEIGRVPEGWPVRQLGSHVSVERGVSYHGSGLAASGMPMHNLNSVLEGGGYKEAGIKYYGGDYRSQHVARPGDLIVANTEQGHHRLLIGYAAIVPDAYPTALFSHHLYRVHPVEGSPLSTDFLGWLLNSDMVHDTVSRYANGTTVNMLPAVALQRLPICVPPGGLIAAFTAMARQIRLRSASASRSQGALVSLRDTTRARFFDGTERPSIGQLEGVG